MRYSAGGFALMARGGVASFTTIFCSGEGVGATAGALLGGVAGAFPFGGGDAMLTVAGAPEVEGSLRWDDMRGKGSKPLGSDVNLVDLAVVSTPRVDLAAAEGSWTVGAGWVVVVCLMGESGLSFVLRPSF